MPTTDYDLSRRFVTLLKADSEDARIGLVYEWVKTGVISKSDFKFLINEIKA